MDYKFKHCGTKWRQ